MTPRGSVRDRLKDFQAPYMDLEVNDAYAQKITFLLFLSRLLVFKHCLSIPDISETFNNALTCKCVLVYSSKTFSPRYSSSSLISNITIKDNTRLLVVNDVAQFLGDQFNGPSRSESYSVNPAQSLLSPILQAFRYIGSHQLTLVTCGTGFSITTPFWVRCFGSDLKDNSRYFEHIEAPGFTTPGSIVCRDVFQIVKLNL
ncbi:hypothetical protein BGW38_001881 [Lunasporangiospora selenospora]|uniref:Uncharacterized protein n=1 Tax=Lunasporangiospora selenospora TaxID=979761 RepID=A0A9P6G130_9FUNG|nr:hypothetical protein BGW38_001881 [Lunasporangiospora selenospora]